MTAIWKIALRLVPLCAGGMLLAAVELPGPPPGKASASAAGDVWTLSNNALSASWIVRNGRLQPFGWVNHLSGASLAQTNCELFRLSFAPQTTNCTVRMLRIQMDTNLITTSVSLDGVEWKILGSFPREEFPGDPESVELGKIDPWGGHSDYPGDVGGLGQCRFDDLVVQDANGAVLLADEFNDLSPAWTVLQSTQAQTSVTVDSGRLWVTAHAHTFAAVQRTAPAGSAVFTCQVDKFSDWAWSWGPGLCVRWPNGRWLSVKCCQAGDDVFLVSSSLQHSDWDPTGFFRCLPLRYELAASDFELVNGPEIVSGAASGYELTARLRHVSTGTEVDWRAVLRDDANYVRQFLTVACTNAAFVLRAVEALDCVADDPHQLGGVQGSPLVGRQWFGALEAPWSVNTVVSNRARSGFAGQLAFSITNRYQFSSVVGVFPDGQQRRGFLYYLERERAAPYRPLLHYNSWFDVYEDVSETNFLAAVNLCDEQLRDRRGVACDGFAIDEGWDDPQAGFWQMNTNKFPNGFAVVRERVAAAGANLGVWISPLGGYDPNRTWRTQRAREAGIIPPDGSLDLSCRSYYDWFLNRCRAFLQNDSVNYLKWDAAGGWVDPHAMALARLATELHQATTNLFINMTVGSWSSPFWLHHVDSTWRGGWDGSYEGVGTDRERSITYRDAQTCRAVAKMSPLYPLNSLMTCGVICTDASAGEDLRHDVRAFFGSGTALQELYLRPAALSSNTWDDIAEAARWARQNADVLVDSHWIGGNPARLEIYGWASWTPRKGILVLRNPSDATNSIAIDAATAFELPADAPRTYRLSAPFADQRLPVSTLSAGEPILMTLLPFEVLVFDAAPQTSYADWVAQSFPETAPPPLTAGDADPDGDGLCNLLEYAFHQDPLCPDSPSPMQFRVENGGVGVLEFPWNLAADDLHYTIETSPDLLTWTTAVPATTQAVYVANGTLRIRATLDAGAEPKRFYRLRVRKIP